MNFGLLTRGNEASIRPTEADFEPLPRQIVTLALVAEQIRNSLISEQLARSLCAETEASVVLVRLEPQDSQGRTDDGVRPELFLNGEVHLPPQVQKTDAGFHSLTLGLRKDPPTPESIASLLRQLSRRFRHVLIQTQVDEHPAPWFIELLVRS